MKTATLLCLISFAAQCAAATISFKDITATNVAKGTDLVLIDSALGGTNYATRTTTLSNAAMSGIIGSLTNWAKLSTNSLIWSNSIDHIGLLPAISTNSIDIAFGGDPKGHIFISAGSQLPSLGTNDVGAGYVQALGVRVLENAAITNTDEVIALGFLAGSGMTAIGGNGAIMLIGSDAGDTMTIENSGVDVIGYNAGAVSTILGSSYVQLLGYQAGTFATISNVVSFLNFGHQAFYNSSAYDAQNAVMLGNRAGYASALGNSTEIWFLGQEAGENAFTTNSSEITVIGPYAGASTTFDGASRVNGLGRSVLNNSAITNSQSVLALGDGAGSGMYGSGFNNVVMIGSNVKATNANDFVIGNASHNYFLPGATVSGSGGTSDQVWAFASDGAVSAGTTNRWKTGDVKTGAGLTLVTTNYVEITINGTAYKLAIVQ